MRGMEHIGAHTIIHIGGSTLHLDTVIMTWVVIALLVAVAWLATRRMKLVPGGIQNAIEFAIEWLDGTIGANISPAARPCTPVIASLFLFILFSNLLGVVPGFKSPTADLNVTLALAAVVMGLTIYAGARSKGLKNYLLGFIKPNPLFLPLNLIEIFTRTLTLAFRLFGNMFAGDVLIIILGNLVAYAVPTLAQAFHVFVGVLQAYLFMMLSVAYVSVATEE
ncbi:MAG TPA: F0F1 ATP synthase subunit A [Firmicutes bacterium]|nr:F0F1 ATP synthase subunit A [Bacillota bacterium]